MIRFILQTSYRYEASGMEGQDFHTLDLAVPELEKQLTSGGFGETGYQRTELMGAEVIRSDSSDLIKAAKAALYLMGYDADRESIGEKPFEFGSQVPEMLRAAIAKEKGTA